MDQALKLVYNIRNHPENIYVPNFIGYTKYKI